MKQLIQFNIALLIFALGCIAGHFHGKSQVYESFYQHADHMIINPVAMEAME